MKRAVYESWAVLRNGLKKQGVDVTHAMELTYRNALTVFMAEAMLKPDYIKEVGEAIKLAKKMATGRGQNGIEDNEEGDTD